MMKVFPNPWGVHPLDAERKGHVSHSLDRHGRPVHVVKYAGKYVGAAIAHAEVEDRRTEEEQALGVKLGKVQGHTPLASNRQTTVFEYLGVPADAKDFCDKFAKATPVEVPESAFYINALKAGDLLPGDGRAARIAKYPCKPADFKKLEAKARECWGYGRLPDEAPVTVEQPQSDPPAGNKPKKGNS
jgi:hypothetical protein